MGENTGIAWCDHTFNPWEGCTKVSAGCANCYAAARDERWHDGEHWGPGAPRKPMSEAYWAAPMKWDKAAEAAGERRRVFCASLADVFDAEGIPEARERLWRLIEATPNLDWLLLTKRPEYVMDLVPEAWQEDFPANVWLGTSVEDQDAAEERVWRLCLIPAHVRFLSVEPLIGPVSLAGLTVSIPWGRERSYSPVQDFIHWVIVGGESGPGARRMDLAWVRDLYEEVGAGAAWFWKQTGAVVAHQLGLKDGKGEDFPEVKRLLRSYDGSELPWVKQEFPEASP